MEWMAGLGQQKKEMDEGIQRVYEQYGEFIEKTAEPPRAPTQWDYVLREIVKMFKDCLFLGEPAENAGAQDQELPTPGQKTGQAGQTAGAEQNETRETQGAGKSITEGRAKEDRTHRPAEFALRHEGVLGRTQQDHQLPDLGRH